MARIRSLHPGQWTDEDFVQMSLAARLLTLAIRNEADDRGVFEWKPVTIKMRLMPVDNVDVGELLAEMVAHNQVRRFEIGGRQYGAIRNFAKFQKPKSPSYTFPEPPDWGSDAASSSAISEIDGVDDDAFPQSGEIAPQMEGREEEEVGEEEREGGRAGARPAPKRVSSLADLAVDDDLREFGSEHGKSADAEIGRFADYCRAKGKTYRDYRAAFKNWLRPKDWEGRRTGDPPEQRWAI
jgi:hypothetical protein